MIEKSSFTDINQYQLICLNYKEYQLISVLLVISVKFGYIGEV